MKDGSGAVQCGQKTLYFRPARLVFSGGAKNDIFTWAQKSLHEILELPPYRHLKEPVLARLPPGTFLSGSVCSCGNARNGTTPSIVNSSILMAMKNTAVSG